jgi:hypothetical protein
MLKHDLSGTQTGAWLQNSGLLKKLRLGSMSGARVAASS